MSTVQERVARGAAWLDATRPGWRDAVKLDELAMDNSCQCICGHVFATEAEASRPPHRINLGGYHYVVSQYACDPNWGIDHGFACGEADIPEPSSDIPVDIDAYIAASDAAWDALEAEWRRVVHTPQPARIPVPA